MKLNSTYSVKIMNYNRIFKDTVSLYRSAVDWFIKVILAEWETLSSVKGAKPRLSIIEHLTVRTARNPEPEHDFSFAFYKFPCYLRRAAINDALGLVSSYKSKLKSNPNASPPHAGSSMPAMYRDNMFIRTSTYTARIKVYIRNTWDWLDIEFKKSDVDYIIRHCASRKECVPTLMRRGKQWFLNFAFEEKVTLNDTPVSEQRILAVDLGLNHACTCCVMEAGGTVYGREFLSLPEEEDSLRHPVNYIKKAQQHGAYKTPRLRAKAKGINDRIAVKTAAFIMDRAVMYDVDVIVFEHLDIGGRKRGGRSKRQRLHLWKAQYVQSMVNDKAHRLEIRISRVCAWNTSRLAFDGSGYVDRGTYTQNGIRYYNYLICTFATGKQYNCDLNAAYNIGARYFVREILKSVPETSRLALEAKVPSAAKRSTSTLSTLLSPNAELMSMAA